MLNQDCLRLFFNAFCASPFILCLLRRIHLCLFLYWSAASGPDNAMCLPGLGGIPISAGFPGIPLCILTLYLCFPSSLTLWPARTKKPFTNAHQQLLTIHPHASSEEMSMEKKRLIVVDLTVPCFLGDHSGSDREWKLTTDERATSSYSFASALWKLLCRSVLIVDLLQKKGTKSDGWPLWNKEVNRRSALFKGHYLPKWNGKSWNNKSHFLNNSVV